ncbi:response regulator transcription factor [Deminuibacter soli]|uniref:DNA-binding response regulator n=1 Tax=Deminuibacter soli TaxID=2291815 RepID=A0A3E1NPY0_9BACT|nr:response regulator transcription factor [Deminuibacter soli]RFM29982.1 DNA-binding response regulator [Deminuibacter soli]
MIQVALVDDHALLRSGLMAVINSFGDYNVLFEADNGRHFISQLKIHGVPDIVLLDITMPEMDGFETAGWIKEHYPDTKVLILSMMDNDSAIIRMLRNGAKGYILKDSKPEVLRAALYDVVNKGFCLNELVTGKLVHLINKNDQEMADVQLSFRETEFLKLCCTEKSYKEIASDMSITPRAVEALRCNLFEKLNTTSRVGLVLYTIKNGMVKV